jgi:hypothetical protein
MSQNTTNIFCPSAHKALAFLAFTPGQEKYGIDIQKVQALRSYDTLTRTGQTHADSGEFLVASRRLMSSAAMGWVEKTAN